MSQKDIIEYKLNKKYIDDIKFVLSTLKKAKVETILYGGNEKYILKHERWIFCEMGCDDCPFSIYKESWQRGCEAFLRKFDIMVASRSYLHNLIQEPHNVLLFRPLHDCNSDKEMKDAISKVIAELEDALKSGVLKLQLKVETQWIRKS